jgi:hypothetical protein
MNFYRDEVCLSLTASREHRFWTQYHKGAIHVRRKTTVVSSLQKARTNRTEAIPCWQAEETRQNYCYLWQVPGNIVKQSHVGRQKKLVKIIVTCGKCRVTLSSKTTNAAAPEQQEDEESWTKRIV